MGSMKNAFFLTAMLLLFVLAVGMRRTVLQAQYHGRDGLDFTLESALHYRLIRILYDTNHLPKVDPNVEYPDGVATWKIYTISDEFVYAWIAKLFSGWIALAERIRWIQVIWFCLSIPWMALWICCLTGSRRMGLLASAFYAVMLASVIRSTGQEISREVFALPLWIAGMACEAAARCVRHNPWLYVLTFFAALFYSFALVSWDLIQYLLYLWTFHHIFCFVRGSWPGSRNEKRTWFMILTGLLLVACLNPYHRAHHLLCSPMMLLNVGLALALSLPVISADRRRIAALLKIGLICIPLVIGLLLPSQYGDSYGHFGELVWAKMRFLLLKPTDPSRLTFNQRIMWVPALHSPGWEEMVKFFPVTILLTIGTIALLFSQKKKISTDLNQLIIFYGSSLIAFIIGVRFHVFLAIYASGIMGIGLMTLMRGKKSMCWLAIVLLCAGLGWEMAHILMFPHTMGRRNVFYSQLRELTGWLKQHAAPEPVLANFGVSASVLAYGGCPIVLHPKFETSAIRQRVREYGEILFKGTEEKFRLWMKEQQVSYYVHAVGELNAPRKGDEKRQMRYFVNALEPHSNAPVRLFEDRPDELLFFRMLYQTDRGCFRESKYRVFRCLSDDELSKATRYSIDAQRFFEKGALKTAEEEAMKVLAIQPNNKHALKIVEHVFSLREQGFSYEADDEEQQQ